MRKLFLLIVVLALLAGADGGARRVAQDQLAERVQKAVLEARSTDVRIDSVPFLGRLAVSGNVSRVRVRLNDVTVGKIHFASITADLRDVHLDRNKMLRDRKVVLEKLGPSAGAAVLSQVELGRLLSGASPVQVQLAPGKATLTLAGKEFPIVATLTDQVLRLQVAGSPAPPAVIQIPKLPLLPCAANLEVIAGAVRFGCSIAGVPPELVSDVSRLPA